MTTANNYGIRGGSATFISICICICVFLSSFTFCFVFFVLILIFICILIFQVKTCKRWQAVHLHRRETFETFYILLHWGDLFQGSYSLKFERWYRFYIADQDTVRYSLCSARENCVSGAEPFKCSTDNLFSSRVFLLNL